MIKLIAMILMVIDHVGYLYFPEMIELRLIGRLAAPMFAYGIAKGYNYSCRNGHFNNYIINLLVLGIVTIFAKYYSFGTIGLNICFTWILSLFILRFMDNKKYVLALITFLIGAYLKVEYGIMMLGLPYVFYVSTIKHNDYNLPILYMIISTYWYYLDSKTIFYIQLIAILSVPMIKLLKKCDQCVKIPKIISYAFYPLHIFILGLIR